jgi:hypothetical protein
MPKLPYQQVQMGTLPAIGGRRASASDFGADVGAEIARAGHAGKQIYDDIGDSEARGVVVGRAQIVTKYAKRLDEAVTSGEDLGKIKEEMNTELGKLGDNLSTRKGQDTLDIATAGTNQMFDAQANAIAVRRAGSQAKLQAGNLLRDLSGTLASNPNALTFALDQTDAFTETLTRVPPEQRAEIKDKLRSELNMTAALAHARLMPESAKQGVAENKWKLTGEQALQVQAEADRTIRARRVDAEYQRTLVERRKDEANDKARRDLYKGLRDGTVGEQDILGNMDLKPATAEHLIDVMDRMAKVNNTEESRTDPKVFNDLRAAIDSPPGTSGRLVDPQRVWMMYGKGLSKDDATFLENRVYANRDEGGYTLAHEVDGTIRTLSRELDKSNLLTIDPFGPSRVQAFTRYVYEQVEKARKDPSADPRELLNPKSPKYVGHAIPTFLSGAQHLQRDLAHDIDKALKPSKSLQEIFR